MKVNILRNLGRNTAAALNAPDLIGLVEGQVVDVADRVAEALISRGLAFAVVSSQKTTAPPATQTGEAKPTETKAETKPIKTKTKK